MRLDKMPPSVIIPTCNVVSLWGSAVEALQVQRPDFSKVLVTDSCSTANTVTYGVI